MVKFWLHILASIASAVPSIAIVVVALVADTVQRNAEVVYGAAIVHDSIALIVARHDLLAMRRCAEAA